MKSIFEYVQKKNRRDRASQREENSSSRARCRECAYEPGNSADEQVSVRQADVSETSTLARENQRQQVKRSLTG